MPPGYDEEAIERSFSYHKPSDGQKNRLVALRSAHKTLARQIGALTSGSAEQTLAFRNLEACYMRCSQSIAFEEPGTEELRSDPLSE